MEDLDGRLHRPSSTMERVTASQVVSLTPSLLYSVLVTPNGEDIALATIYDGHNTGEEVKLDVMASIPETSQLSFDPPLYMKKGIYVALNAYIKSVVVQYSSVAE